MSEVRVPLLAQGEDVGSVGRGRVDRSSVLEKMNHVNYSQRACACFAAVKHSEYEMTGPLGLGNGSQQSKNIIEVGQAHKQLNTILSDSGFKEANLKSASKGSSLGLDQAQAHDKELDPLVKPKEISGPRVMLQFDGACLTLHWVR